ncbi:MAG: type 4a pilus biogenesis protein PilO [Acidimicrobiales bacterium]
MSAASTTAAALKRTPVIVAMAVAVVVVIVWLLAFFLPQGHKLSTLNAKERTLQQAVDTGNAKVAQLKHTFQHVGQLEAEQAKFQAYVPSTPDLFKSTANYTSSLSATVAASGVTLTSVSPGAAKASSLSTSPSKSSSSTSSSTSTSLTVIPVTLSVTGTYDHLLTLVTNIYALPRLTDINSLALHGGGPSTNRSTPLQATLDLVTFTTAQPPSKP